MVLAGASGCGRTVIALQIAASWLRENEIVAFLSAEPSPLLLRQAATLGADLEGPVHSEQLVLLELDSDAPACLVSAGGRALIETIRDEHPSVSLIVVDPITAITSEILDEVLLRAITRDLIAATPHTALVFTVETDRQTHDAPVERVLAEVCGSYLNLGRRTDGRRTLTVGKTRAGAGRAEAVEFEIGEHGAQLLREIRPEATSEILALEAPASSPIVTVEPDSKEPMRSPAEEPSPAETGCTGPRRILLIDDDEETRNEFVSWLSDRYEVVTACDGFQGVAKLLGERPDLIVLDLLLPRVSGYEVIATLHRVSTGIPILVVTSRIERRGDVLGPIALGATDVLKKPVGHFELLHKVESSLRLREPMIAAIDPVEAGALFAPTNQSRVLSAGEFRDRLRRSVDFGARFGTPSSLVAIEAPSGEVIDRLVASAESELRLEDGLLVTSKRRLLVLLVAASCDQAKPVVTRIIAALGGGETPRARIRLRVLDAMCCDANPSWKSFFADLEEFTPDLDDPCQDES